LWDNQDFSDPEKLIAMRFSFEEGTLPFLWYENNISIKLQNLSWDNVKHSFLKNYKNADYRGMNIFKIFQIKLKKNEKVSQFTGRYLQAMKNAGWDRYDSHASSQNNHLIGVAKRVLWLRLPPSVRQYCQLKGLRDYKNVKELALAVNRYPGTPPDLDKIADDGQPDCEVISVKSSPGLLTKSAKVKPYVKLSTLDLVSVFVERPRIDPRDSLLRPMPFVPTPTVSSSPATTPSEN
jgi:hypothetical protein